MIRFTRHFSDAVGLKYLEVFHGYYVLRGSILLVSDNIIKERKYSSIFFLFYAEEIVMILDAIKFIGNNIKMIIIKDIIYLEKNPNQNHVYFYAVHTLHSINDWY